VLRRRAKEKKPGAVTVSVEQDAKEGPPCRLRVYAESHKIISKLLPGHACLGSLNAAQIKQEHQFGMTAPEPSYNHHQPTKNEPCRHVAIRGYRCLCPPKARLTRLPTGNAQKQGPDDCADRVLKIGDQLDGQQGKGAFTLPTQKPGNGDLFFSKFREKLNGISPVGVNFLITIKTATDGAGGTNIARKLKPLGKEGVFVFPNRLEFINVGDLNFSTALPTRRQASGRPQTVSPSSFAGLGYFIKVNPLTL